MYHSLPLIRPYFAHCFVSKVGRRIILEYSVSLNYCLEGGRDEKVGNTVEMASLDVQPLFNKWLTYVTELHFKNKNNVS